MKKIIYAILLLGLLPGCSKDDDKDNGNTDPVYRQRMREFVAGISQYAKSIKPGFLIVPQNGIELVSNNDEAAGGPTVAYLNAIDAVGQEDFLYGYDNDNQATPADRTAYLKNYLNIVKAANKTVLITDYCSAQDKMSHSYSENGKLGFVSFVADQRELNHIPLFPKPVHNENNAVITSLSQAKNFLYLLDLEKFANKDAFINAVKATNYDVLITDLYFNETTSFTAQEVNELKKKANGGRRLVISYMSIGEAEDYRYYWQQSWRTNKPSWLDRENPDWPGNYKVKYWDPQWQSVIYGTDNSYTKKIIDAGFDGTYLDIIDAFEFYE